MSDENQRATSEPKRPRPRFSLLTLLLLTTIVALGVALVTVSFEVVPLRNEVEKLRAELGHLVVDTEVDDRIQAIAQNVYEDLTWKWRVYLPPGRKCSIHTKWDEIPKKAMPDAELSGGFQVTPTRLEDSTEHIIVCAVRESNDGKHWMMRLEQRQNGITSWREVTIPRKCWGWLENGPGGYTTDGVSGFDGRVVSTTPSSMVLLRWRQMEKTSPTTSTTPQGPAKGLMVWLEEDK